MDGPTPDPYDYLAALKDGRDRLGRRLSPYVGLRHFDLDSAALLFGRGGSAEAVLSKFETSSTIFVIGGSGCGKSSIVRGAVMQKLRLVTRPVQNRHGPWFTVEMRPGIRPVDGLVDAVWQQVFAPFYSGEADARDQLDSALGVGEDELRERINATLEPARTSGEPPLHRGLEVVRGWIDRLDHGLDAAEGDAPPPPEDRAGNPLPPIRDHRLGSVNLMVLIDQFEEIFRPEVAREDRRALVAMMRHVFLSRPEGVFLAVTMRAEDLHRCAEEPDLPSMINSSTHLVGWLTRKELREAVTGPARTVLSTWKIRCADADEDDPYDTAVVSRLVDHVEKLQRELAHKSDHLPLFQHALTVLWRHCCERWDRERQEARTTTSQDAPAGLPFRVTEQDLDDVIKAVNGDTSNWMARALEKTVEDGLENARARFAEHLRGGAGRWDADPRALALASLRAAITAMASKDEQGRYHRRFVRPAEVTEDRLKSLFSEDDLNLAGEALTAALDFLAGPEPGLLTRSGDPHDLIYDVTHEALIRNSPTLGRWLESDAEIVAAIRRVVERARQSAGYAPPEDSVQREDKPVLERLFEPEPPPVAGPTVRGTPASGEAEAVETELQRQARRLYRRTYSRRRFGELAAEKLDEETDPDAVIDKAEELYVARRDYDKSEAKYRARRTFVIGGLAAALLIVVGLTIFYARQGLRDNQLAELRDVYAMSPAPQSPSQPINSKLSEMYVAATRLEDHLSTDQGGGWAGLRKYAEHGAANIRDLVAQVRGSAGGTTGQADVNDARFLAHWGLDTQMRESFGRTYQIRQASSGWAASKKDLFCGTTGELSRAPVHAGAWGLNLEGGAIKIQQKEAGGEWRETMLTKGDTGEPLHVATGSQVCLGADGRVLTIVREGGALPELYFLHSLISARTTGGNTGSSFELLPLLPGSYPPGSLESGQQPAVKVDAIRYDGGESPGFFIVRFDRGDKSFEAVFAPYLVVPALGSDAPDGVELDYPEADGVMAVEFRAQNYGRRAGVPGLFVQVAFLDCNDAYRVAVSWVVRKNADFRRDAWTTRSDCTSNKPDEEVRYGEMIASFRSVRIQKAQLRDGDVLELLMSPESGEALVFPVALPPSVHHKIISYFAGDDEDFDPHFGPDKRLRSVYCRINPCYEPDPLQ